MIKKRDVRQPDDKTMTHIIKNYIQSEKALVNQLYFRCSQSTTIGGFREEIWRGMFEQIVPKKFVIEQSVFIIDSEGRVSNEVDLAIFDETYTPYIFRYGKLKFLPIEAVAVVIECKSTSLDPTSLKNWVESIIALKTARESYIRMYDRVAAGGNGEKSTQTATRPLRILCCLNEKCVNEELDSSKKEMMFDFVIRAQEEGQTLRIEPNTSKGNLGDWFMALNHVGQESDQEKLARAEVIKGVTLEDYQVNHKNGPVSLLTFNLQLNQLLMLINNPILFPHKAYAKMFDGFAKEVDLKNE